MRRQRRRHAREILKDCFSYSYRITKPILWMSRAPHKDSNVFPLDVTKNSLVFKDLSDVRQPGPTRVPPSMDRGLTLPRSPRRSSATSERRQDPTWPGSGLGAMPLPGFVSLRVRRLGAGSNPIPPFLTCAVGFRRTVRGIGRR